MSSLAQLIERERERQRQLTVAALVGLATTGLTAAAAAWLWQWVGAPELRVYLWPVFAITAFFALAGGVVAGLLQAGLALMFSRESGRKVAEMMREATKGEQRTTPP